MTFYAYILAYLRGSICDNLQSALQMQITTDVKINI